MKIALCMSGVPRGEYQGLTFIQNMSEKYDCFLFLHSWNPETFPSQESWSKKLSVPFDENSIPISKDRMFHAKENYNDREPEFKDIYNSIPEQYRWRKDLGPCSMFYGIRQASLLKEKFELEAGEKFDCVFRMRFETKINFITIDNFDLNQIHIPSFDSYPLCDQFAFSNSDNMSYYSSCYQRIADLAQADLFHPERMLKQHLKEKTINLLHFGNDMCL